MHLPPVCSPGKFFIIDRQLLTSVSTLYFYINIVTCNVQLWIYILLIIQSWFCILREVEQLWRTLLFSCNFAEKNLVVRYKNDPSSSSRLNPCSSLYCLIGHAKSRLLVHKSSGTPLSRCGFQNIQLRQHVVVRMYF